MAAPVPHRYLLVRCEVENADAQPSLRFVEYSQFRLWQYLMANKHSIVVTKAGLGLWLPESEWESQSLLFEHAGTSEAVIRVHFEIYEPATGLCDVVQRFVPKADFHAVVERLQGLLPASVRNSDQCIMTIEPGQMVVREHSISLDSLGRHLALADP